LTRPFDWGDTAAHLRTLASSPYRCAEWTDATTWAALGDYIGVYNVEGWKTRKSEPPVDVDWGSYGSSLSTMETGLHPIDING